MSALHRWFRRLSALWGGSRRDREMAEEMRLHLERRTAHGIEAGLAPAAARYGAERRFGGIEQIKEQVRDERSFPWIEQLLQDFRYGVRMLQKRPQFAAVIVAILGVGIGATTVIFSIVDGVILKPLPFPDAGRLVALYETNPQRSARLDVAPKSFQAWREQGSSIAAAALTQNLGFVMTGAGEPVRRFGFRVTEDYFSVFGVQPLLGRTFDAKDFAEGKTDLVVLNYKFWTSQFESDPSVIGRKVRINNLLYTVIGVMPKTFFPETLTDPWIFVPLVITPRDAENYDAHWFKGWARIKPGRSVEQAESELNVISRRLAAESPATNRGLGVAVVPMLENQVGSVRPLLLTLLAAVGVLLLIACVNVANLLLAQASTRAREIAVRSALGASRRRIVRQLLCESLLISGCGSLLGVALAYVSKDFLLSFAPIGLPRAGQVAIDGGVLLFSCVLTALTGVGFGLVPALQASRVDLPAAMKDGSRGTSDGGRMRLRSVLVVTEVALALILLFNASLLRRSFDRLNQVDMGFEVGRGVGFQTSFILSGERYATPERIVRFDDEIISRVSAVSGIQDVAVANAQPLFGRNRRGILVEERPHLSVADAVPANFYAVSPRYFRLFRIRLLRGRLFDEHDRATRAPVAIVSEGFAKKHFAGGEALGKRLLVLGTTTWPEVVGIVNDVREDGPAQESPGQVYTPVAQSPSSFAILIFRLERPIAGLRPVLRKELDAIDPDLPLAKMDESFDSFWMSDIGPQRFALFLFSVFSGIALLLSAMGIYGVVSYSVEQRTKEIGIRMALGAQARDIWGLVFSQSGRVVGLGLLIGIAGALGSTRVVASLLFNVSAHDPLSLVTVPFVMALVAGLACWLPARRATKVSPMTALRCD